MTASDRGTPGRRSPDRADPGTTQEFGLSGGSDREPAESLRSPEPPARIGPYEILAPLGEGAMGRVFKAFDTRLQRHVALKLLRIDDPAVVDRFSGEARAQAQVDHDNVCKVFDVGEDAGRNYIALQYLPGEPLTTASKRMSLKEKVQVAAEVAEGLHAAHRQGLIHRDVKPGNIMVEEVPGRGWKAWVLDFGLAREIAAEGVTLTGVAVGTPQFMAPEQVRGDPARLDRRVDIYSLGATLYAILAGRPVHAGSTPLEILVKAATDDPLPLRRIAPEVPVDLETIVMKCLEREPGRRYESARAVAEDLRRFIDGEPILARPPTFSYRLKRAVARHRGLVALGALATMVALILIGLWWQERATAQRQAEIAQRFGQKVERAESLLWREYVLPLHDTTSARTAARQRLAEIEDEMQGLGRVARGPGHAALGRGFLALDETAHAREHLLQAWKSGYRPPEVAFSLGVATGRAYGHELRLLGRIRNQEARAARRAEIDATLRDPALELFRASAGTELDAPEYLDALLAYYSGDRDRGVERARAALAKVPWFYEAKLLEGEIELGDAAEKFTAGEHADGLAAAMRAVRAYEDAAMIADSDPRGHGGACQAWGTILHNQVWRLGAGDPGTYAALLQACEMARTADPARVSTLNALASSATTWAEHQLGTGEDATAAIAAAENAAAAAVRIAPSDVDALLNWVWAAWQRGKQLMTSGRDPVGALREAITRGERAVSTLPENPRIQTTLALTALDLASYQVDTGGDPEPDITRSIEGFGDAIELDPTGVPHYVNLGIAYEVKLEYSTGRMGEDPAPLAARATDALGKALELNPSLFWAHRTLGAIRRIQAEHAVLTGADPTPYVQDALASLEQAAQSAPKDGPTHLNRAKALLVRARYRNARGDEADFDLRAARDACATALEINPGDAAARATACDVELEAAGWALRRGTSPEPYLKAAADYLRGAPTTSEGAVSGYGRRGEIEWVRATWLGKVGEDPMPAIRRGLASVEVVLSKHPKSASAFLARGKLRLLAADVRRHTPAGRVSLADAIADLDRAKEIRPALAAECERLAERAKGGDGP